MPPAKAPVKTFTVRAYVFDSREVFKVRDLTSSMPVPELKKLIEFSTGIPAQLQKLKYLDQADIDDNSIVGSYDIVPGGTITVFVWAEWATLIKCVAENNLPLLKTLGVTADSDFSSPSINYMNKRQRKLAYLDRGFIALFLAGHRGFADICKFLIENEIDVNGQTKSGRTPLHVCAAHDQGEIIDLLLQSGADLEQCDEDGLTPLMAAQQFGHKSCSRHLFMFKWKQRAKKVKRIKEVPMFAHQYTDSSLPLWKEGPYQTLYVQKILPPGEFIGGSLDAPKFEAKPPPFSEEGMQKRRENQPPDEEEGKMPPSYDEWVGVLQIQDAIRKQMRIREREARLYDKKLKVEREKEEREAAFRNWWKNKKQQEKDADKKQNNARKKQQLSEERAKAKAATANVYKLGPGGEKMLQSPTGLTRNASISPDFGKSGGLLERRQAHAVPSYLLNWRDTAAANGRGGAVGGMGVGEDEYEDWLLKKIEHVFAGQQQS